MKYKYHTRLNHDMVNTRRKSETKKNRKSVKAEELVRRVCQKAISKAKHYRGTFADLPREGGVWIVIGNGKYSWNNGVYDEEIEDVSYDYIY